MIWHGRLGAASATISLTQASFAVGVDDRRVAAWDLGGRLYSFWRDGHTYRRGLNGRVLHKWTDAGKRRDHAEDAAGDALLDETSGLARAVLDSLDKSAWEAGEASSSRAESAVREALESAARFDADAGRLDRARFERIYQPIGVLPPDQYLALVLQATEGCSFNTCTFCNLYQQRYRVKTPEELGRHIADVRAYLGRSLELRDRSIFLGAANALAVPTGRLLGLVEMTSREFDGRRRGICAFADAFTGTLKDIGEYRALAALGLRRVYIGLESGHDPLLAFVGKPATRDDAIATVRTIKAAGVNVGVIVMIGLGGHAFAEGHVADTVVALNGMGLGAGDLIYFSELVEMPGTPYPALTVEQGIRPLGTAERQGQEQAIRRQLSFPGPPPRLATYDVREFVY